LLRSDGLAVIPRQVQKSIQLLDWQAPRNISEFPELKPLECEIEMKILDIVLGDDPLDEGLIVEDDNKRRAQLAEKNLKDALGQEGNKRIQLQDR
jgi:hypothetical protein